MAKLRKTHSSAGTNANAQNSAHSRVSKYGLLGPSVLVPNETRVAFVRLITAIITKVSRDNVSALLAVGSRYGFFNTWCSNMRTQAPVIQIIRNIEFATKA